MMRAFADYTYIAGDHSPSGSIWQGPDHLLVIEGQGWPISFAEIYRRVDYANVQSLTLVRTRHFAWLAAVWGAGGLLFALLTVLTRSADPYIPICFAIPAVLLLVRFAIHLAKGPTCACALQTNVQLLRLRPLHRLRVAEPVMQRLASLCRQHQGELTEAEASPAPAGSGSQAIAGTKPPWTGSVWTAVAGVVLLLWGGAVMAELFVPGIPFVLLDATLGTAALIFSIVALASSLRMQAPGPLLGVLWGGLAMELLAGVALVAPAMGNIVTEDVVGRGQFDPDSSFNVERILAAMANITLADAGHWGWGIIGVGAVLALLGLATLALGGMRKAAAAAPVAAPPPPPPVPPNDSAT
jgi:hypothetical protein